MARDFLFQRIYHLALSEFSVRTEYVHDLVDVHLLHVLAGRLQILTRIEVSRMLSKMLADSSSHSQTRVGVDVDLADSALPARQAGVRRPI